MQRHTKLLELGTVLGDALTPLGEATSGATERLRLSWPAVVGFQVAAHTEVVELNEGLLVVRVDTGPWREVLFELRGEVTLKLKKVAPALRGIHLVNRPLRLRREAEAQPRPPARLPDAPDAPDPRTAGIGQPDLRSAFDRLLATRDAQQRSKQP